MGQPVRGASTGWGKRVLALVGVAAAAASLAMLVSLVPPTRAVADRIDTAIYDAFYRRRPAEKNRDCPVVIIAVDQDSIDRMAAKEDGYRWPWPREYWGAMLEYLQKCGAKVVAIDLLFEEPSGYERETGDDKLFAAKLDDMRMPVILAFQAKGAEQPRFVPPVKNPQRFGAVDVIDSAVIRSYIPFVEGKPSLAVETVRAAKGEIPPWAERPFLLHFYGPTRHNDRSTTFPYISAYNLITAIAADADPSEASQDVFKGKTVLVGTTAAATFDLKSAPMSDIYPSVEAHATAIVNLLLNQRVETFGLPARATFTCLVALLATAGAVVPRRAAVKLILSLLAIAAVFVSGYVLFAGARIQWLAPTMPLLAAVLGTIGGLSWTYFIEDRQRRAILKILSQYVSPHVAHELSRKGELSLGGQRREMTVLFTDIAGFTNLSEQMNVEQLESFINNYLTNVSDALLNEDATVDKFIGDAVMCFWNAPLDQPDHAERACRAALQVRRLERRHQTLPPGSDRIHTRIGINTGIMVVGNMGSAQKVNYTVIGDAVNLASRLEGSNKIYGSQILVSEATVRLVHGRFLFRRLDRLRVKGRNQPLAVYELMDGLDTATPGRRRLAERYETAFEAYEKQQWETAEKVLVELRTEFQDDGPTLVLLERVQTMRADPPPADWDGVHDAQIK